VALLVALVMVVALALQRVQLPPVDDKCAAAMAEARRSVAAALAALPPDTVTAASLCMRMPYRVAVGLGTGRSGTTALASLVGGQHGGWGIHEMDASGRIQADDHPDFGVDFFPWAAGETARRALVESQYALFDRHACRASPATPPMVAVPIFYTYLAYVAEYLAVDPCVRFIALERNRSQVVRSFLAKTGARNQWGSQEEMAVAPDKWTKTFPRFPQAPTKAAAIGLFWDHYHEELLRFSSAHPQHLRIFSSPAVFGSAATQADLLRFAGFADPIVADAVPIINGIRDTVL
jgi:hypothetical protein